MASSPTPSSSPPSPPSEPRTDAELRRGVLQLVTLSLLDEPRYGYELVRLLGEAGFATEEGTLYPILRRFEEQGALEATWDTSRARPRKYYRISDAGRRVRSDLLQAWRRVRDATDGVIGRTT